jgi:trehalose 6-phosphate synthase
MNLVSKEYCATRTDGDGVLVLSEFAGAAAELQRGALLVNPYTSRAWPMHLRR